MEIFSALLAICAGNSPVTGEFPTQRPVTRSFDVYFDLRPNERLSKQWWGWWFETLSRSLWRHRNVLVFIVAIATRMIIPQKYFCYQFIIFNPGNKISTKPSSLNIGIPLQFRHNPNFEVVPGCLIFHASWNKLLSKYNLLSFIWIFICICVFRKHYKALDPLRLLQLKIDYECNYVSVSNYFTGIGQLYYCPSACAITWKYMYWFDR